MSCAVNSTSGVYIVELIRILDKMNFVLKKRLLNISYLVCYQFNLQTQRNNLLFVNSFFPPKRFNHIKFRPNLFKKQVSILKRFNDEIEGTMEKIKSKQKVKVKRNKQILSQTINTLMNMNGGNYEQTEGNNISSGSPEQLAVRRDGFSKSFLTTRMKILNTNYSRAIAEIFISDEELSKKLEEYKIRITQVRISTNHRILHIYWVSSNENVDMKFVADYLNSNKGRIHELLIETNYTNSVPWIVFVYDLQESYGHEISIRLNKCKQDLDNYEAKEENNCTTGIKDINEKFNIVDQISFEDPFETVYIDDYCQKMLKCNLQDYYSKLKLRMPSDMHLNIFNLDYEFLMNKVLQNLHRTRAQNQLSSYNSNAVGQHLPSIDLSKGISDSSKIEYNTEERIKAIKKFVALNKKRKNKIELKLKRMILEEEFDRMDSYEHLRVKLEESMADVYKEIEPFDEDAYSEDS